MVREDRMKNVNPLNYKNTYIPSHSKESNLSTKQKTCLEITNIQYLKHWDLSEEGYLEVVLDLGNYFYIIQVKEICLTFT